MHPMERQLTVRMPERLVQKLDREAVRHRRKRSVVDIRQRSTGQTNRYVLPAIPPGVDELSGLQDRTGFRP
jgi:hypothetical protein